MSNYRNSLRKKNRRISLNLFKGQFEGRPYKKTQQLSIGAFENSLMLLQIIKKHEKLMFINKENEVNLIIQNIEKHNNLLSKIKECGMNKKQKVLVSSFKVLEQLDVNRKHAYQILEQENKQISDRIYTIQCALQRMNASKRSQALCEQYLLKLQNKINNRKKIQKRLTKMIEDIQQKNQEETEKLKNLFQQYMGNSNQISYENQNPKQFDNQLDIIIKEQEESKRPKIKNRQKIEQLMQFILTKIDQ